MIHPLPLRPNPALREQQKSMPVITALPVWTEEFRNNQGPMPYTTNPGWERADTHPYLDVRFLT
jgi:hypothetical protein